MPDNARMLRQARIGLLLLNVPILIACIVVVATQPPLRTAFIAVGVAQMLGLVVILRFINAALAKAQQSGKDSDEI